MGRGASPAGFGRKPGVYGFQSAKEMAASRAREEEEEEEQARKQEQQDMKDRNLLFSFLAMVVFALGNRLFQKLQTYPMYNYPFFLFISSAVLYVPVCFLYILPAMYCVKNSPITQEQRQISQYKFAVMGFLDSVAGFMQTFGVNYITNASMIVLLNQSAIPISMFISRTFLGARYTYPQYSGALVVVVGIIVVLLPNLTGSSDSGALADDLSAPPSAGTTDSSSQIFWSVMIVLSCIPMCLSSVYKEQALGQMDIDVIYLNGWVAVYQSLASCVLLAYPSALVMNLTLAEIPLNLWQGCLCFVGINSVTEPGPGQIVDDCAMAPAYASTYLVLNVGYNVLMIMVLKYGSANIMWLASTVLVPLTNVAFSLKIVPNHQPLQITDMWGLICIMFGLLLYRFFSTAYNFILAFTTGKLTPEEEEAQRRARLVGRGEEARAVRFIGFNQLEALQPLIDTRVWKAQKSRLFRSPAQIRGSFLLRIGIPPSPNLTVARNRRQSPHTTPIPARAPVASTAAVAINMPR